MHGVCCCRGLFAVSAAAGTAFAVSVAAGTAAAAAWVDHVFVETVTEPVTEPHAAQVTIKIPSKRLEDEEEHLDDDVHLAIRVCWNAAGREIRRPGLRMFVSAGSAASGTAIGLSADTAVHRDRRWTIRPRKNLAL